MQNSLSQNFMKNIKYLTKGDMCLKCAIDQKKYSIALTDASGFVTTMSMCV